MPGMKQAIRWIPALDGPLRLVLGIGLGAMFCYSGFQKHLAPAEFAEAILAYQLLPQALVGLTAVVFPWLELTIGALLIIGFLMKAEVGLASGFGLAAMIVRNGGLTRRSSLLLIMLQLGLFILVLLITMARGMKIDCGCGLFSQRQVGPAAVLEDGLFLLLTGLLYWREWRLKFD